MEKEKHGIRLIEKRIEMKKTDSQIKECKAIVTLSGCQGRSQGRRFETRIALNESKNQMIVSVNTVHLPSLPDLLPSVKLQRSDSRD